LNLIPKIYLEDGKMIYEDLNGKKVLVTGSSSGIGAAAAIEFAKQGCFVGVHYFKTGQGGQDTLTQVKKYSSGILLKADVRNQNQVKKMVSKFVRAAGGIDILVNNAGDLIERQSFETATAAYHDNIYQTNIRSVFFVTQAALPRLKKNKGCIVNVGSVAGHHGGGAGSGIYAGAKAAVATETIAMAKEFGKYGIRVNTIVPGLIETRFHERYSSAERRAKVAKETPLGKNGTALDIAKAILFLASSEAAGFITGEYIAVNGGLYMRA
jgi:NAD(P)-dependent dehydrogenase (short-subunit alcohol dehydrogenase family)